MRTETIELTPTDSATWEFKYEASEFTISNYYGSTTLDCKDALKLASFITNMVSEFGG